MSYRVLYLLISNPPIIYAYLGDKSENRMITNVRSTVMPKLSRTKTHHAMKLLIYDSPNIKSMTTITN